MYLTRIITRQAHFSASLWNFQKTPLASLRKKTGYTFSNCKKALEMHDNDIIKAEEWLKRQAQELGWSKATKLQGRQTSQGLVGVLVKNQTAALVEINCETDFVARNEKFHDMVGLVANSILQHVSQIAVEEPIFKVNFNTDQLNAVKSFDDDKPLSDHLALLIGTIGENASLKRAICFKFAPDVHIGSYAHPSETKAAETLLGKFAGVVALKQVESKDDVDLDDLGKKLSQHVVGLDPKTIGSPTDEPIANEEEETSLIHQSYLHDETATVEEILNENGVKIIDFVRFGCGESMDESADELEKLETCQ